MPRDINEMSYKMGILQEEIESRKLKMQQGDPNTIDFAENKKIIQQAENQIAYYKKHINEFLDWERGTQVKK